VRAWRSSSGPKPLEYARANDTLIVWRFDGLGRSLRHLVEMGTALEHAGSASRLLNESIETRDARRAARATCPASSPALAEFERDLIRERTLAGLGAPLPAADGPPTREHGTPQRCIYPGPEKDPAPAVTRDP